MIMTGEDSCMALAQAPTALSRPGPFDTMTGAILPLTRW